MGKIFRHSLLLLFVFSFLTGKMQAQVYTNGVLSTGATAADGTAAPAGFTWSEVQKEPTATIANSTTGVGGQIAGTNSLADDFTVPAGPSWNVSKITVYAYSTGAPATPSPFNDLRIRIHNSNPQSGPTTIVFGDLTTNRLSSTSSADVYRIPNSVILTTPTAPNTNRKVWKLEANVSVTLAPGTYWLEFQTGTALASNFVPLSSPLAVRTLPGYNAIQRTGTTTVWNTLADNGVTPAGASANAPVNVDIPFQIEYSTGGCTTPNPGNTIASAASVCPSVNVDLSLQNATPGAGVSYQWQSGPSATGPFTDITGAMSSTYSTLVNTATYFQAVVTCGTSSVASNPVLVDVTPASGCYCAAASLDATFETISNVKLGSIDNPSTAAVGYEDFSTISTSLEQLNPTPITVTLDGSFGTDQVVVFIDYNHNGSFADPGETVFTATGVGPHTGTITVPASAMLGTTKMRIRLHDTLFGPNATSCGNSDYGQVEDYTVDILPCEPAVINDQPANATSFCSGSASFTVDASGTGLSYQWQQSVDGGTTWTIVNNGGTYSGASTSTLTLSDINTSFDGYMYQVALSGPCTPIVLSTPATLTLGAFVAQVSPAAPVVCAGQIGQINITNTSLSATSPYISSGTLNTVIPDNNAVGTGANVGISNAINVTTIPAGSVISDLNVKLNIVHSWVGDLVIVLKAPNGKIYNLDYVLSNTGGAGATAGFTNTIISTTGTATLASGSDPYTGIFAADNQDPATADPLVPIGPAGFLPNTRNIRDLYSTANGDWTIALYDYYDDLTNTNKLVDWSISFTYGAPQLGVFSPTAGLFTDAAATIPYTGTPVSSVYVKPTAATSYTVVVSNATCSSAPTTIPITIGTAIDPATVTTTGNQKGCDDGSVSFTASATTGSPISYQWQEDDGSGAGFQDITDGGIYSGATTATLTLTGLTSALDDYRYRAILSVNSCGSTVTTRVDTLSVNPIPAITLQTSTITQLYPGRTATISVVPASAGATYQWFRNGVAVPGQTGNSIVVDVDGFGEYTATMTNANGCTGLSDAKTISSAPNDIVFIYPSPNTGQFQVRYYTSPGNPLPRTLTIYDSKGARIYSKLYDINEPYSKMAVDMRSHGKGIYRVELGDRNGKRIKTGSVIIL